MRVAVLLFPAALLAAGCGGGYQGGGGDLVYRNIRTGAVQENVPDYIRDQCKGQEQGRDRCVRALLDTYGWIPTPKKDLPPEQRGGRQWLD